MKFNRQHFVVKVTKLWLSFIASVCLRADRHFDSPYDEKQAVKIV